MADKGDMKPVPQDDTVGMTLTEAEPMLENGDVLAWRANSLIGAMIARSEASRYSHAGMVCRCCEDTLMVAEVREFKGGRIVTLSSQVLLYPGQIDVFKIDTDRYPEFDRDGAVRHMIQYAGQEYGYWGVAKLALVHIPFIRHRVTASMDDLYVDELPAFCSQAVSGACRLGGGVDPVKHRSDNSTEPGHLPASLLFRYLCTLQGVDV